MSASAVFDKLCLRSAEDLLNLSKLLIEHLKTVIQANGDTIDPNRQAALKRTADEALKDMDKLIAVADSDLYGFGTPSGGHLKSPMLPPLSPLQKDDEVVSLEAEVEATSKRVAELRVKMQAQVQEQLTAKLAACRPSSEITPPRTEAPQTSEGDDAGAMSPAASELRNRLVEATGKMPELLARLEETKNRLNKVLDAASAPRDTHNRPPPNTVERAVLGNHADYDDDEEEYEEEEEGEQAAGASGEGQKKVGVEAGEREKAREPSELQKALQTGLVSTRARGGIEVEPVPFPGAEADEDFGIAAAAAEKQK